MPETSAAVQKAKEQTPAIEKSTPRSLFEQMDEAFEKITRRR